MRLWLARLIAGEHYELVDKGHTQFCKLNWGRTSELVVDLNNKLTYYRAYFAARAMPTDKIEKGDWKL